MQKGRSITDLAKELQRQAENKQDFKAPTTMMVMSVQAAPREPEKGDFIEHQKTLLMPRPMIFQVGDKFTGFLTELMHDQLGEYVKIPAPYYDRMRNGDNSDRAMLASNVNHWLRRTKETRLVRTLDGKARAFLSNRYRTIDNFDIANVALPIFIGESKKLGGIEVESSDVTDTRMYIKVTSKRLTYEVKKGDIVQAGVAISNSEVGKRSVRVEPFLKRCICDNGAIIEDAAIRKFHLGRQSAELEAAEQVFRDETRQADDKAFVMKLGDVIRASFDDANFEKLKGITIDATKRKITAPIQDVVEEVAGRFSLSDPHKDSFLKNLIEGGDITQWGLANAITAIANTEKSYEKATELEYIGGLVMTMPVEKWYELAA